MYRITKLIIFGTFFLGSNVTLQAQTLEEIKVGLKNAMETITGVFPSRFKVAEGYTADIEIEFPNGYNLSAEEDTKATVNYSWAPGRTLTLLFDIDSEGNITADKYHLLDVFKTDWNIDWSVKFDSSGMLKSASSYWESLKKIAETKIKELSRDQEGQPQH